MPHFIQSENLLKTSDIKLDEIFKCLIKIVEHLENIEYIKILHYKFAYQDRIFFV